MWFIFWVTFTIGQYPMDWIDNGVAWLTALCESQMPEGTLQALVCDGILGGVGSVIVFLPNILILYFFISILEDSGSITSNVKSDKNSRCGSAPEGLPAYMHEPEFPWKTRFLLVQPAF